MLDRTIRLILTKIIFSRLEIVNVDVDLPVAVLALVEPRLKPLPPYGDVQLHIANLTVGDGGMRGDVELEWRAAGSAFSPVSASSSYELRLDGQGNKLVRALLSTSQGAIQLDGSGSWTRGRIADFRATIRVPSQHQPQFTPLLRLISVQRDEGTFELQLK